MKDNSTLALARTAAIVIIIIVVLIAASGAIFFYLHPSTPPLLTTSQNNSSSRSASSTTSQSASTTSATTSSSSLFGPKIALPYNSSTNTVTMELVIETGLATLVNYNGTNFGAMEIFVPAQSNMNITLVNQESVPHNLVIVKNTTAFPTNKDVGAQGSVLFAIGTSTTTYGYDGTTHTASGVYNTISAGTYWLACGINKHAGEGLWAVIVASTSVTSPYVVVKNPALSPAGFG